MDSAKQLKELSKVYMEAVYGGGKKKDTSMVVTNADKKANTKAYQNLKAGVKGYKAADHMEEGKKADKDYDGDGKIESGKDEYFGSKDKAIKKAMGKELKDLQKAATTLKGKNVAKADVVTGVGYKEETILEKQKDTPKQVAAVIDFYRSKKGTGEAVKDTEEGDTKDAKKERDYAAFEREKMKKDDPNWKSKKYHTGMHGEEKRWQDDDGDGKWYEKSDVDGKISKREKKAKKHDCASKVKHEQFGIGNPVKGMHDLDENGKVVHYDVLFGHGVEKNVPVSSLEILEGHMHEHVIREKMAAKDYDGAVSYTHLTLPTIYSV